MRKGASPSLFSFFFLLQRGFLSPLAPSSYTFLSEQGPPNSGSRWLRSLRDDVMHHPERGRNLTADEDDDFWLWIARGEKREEGRRNKILPPQILRKRQRRRRETGSRPLFYFNNRFPLSLNLSLPNKELLWDGVTNRREGEGRECLLLPTHPRLLLP